MSKPSLDLAVEVTAANGTQYRWGPGRRAGDVPQGLSFKTKQSEGFADASLTLSRRIDREYVDLNLLDSVVISGAGGSIAYEGRVAALPRSMQQTHTVSVQAVGWMAHARDRKMQEIYVDRDLSSWEPASSGWQRNNVATNAYAQSDGAVVAGQALPALKLSFSGVGAAKAACTSQYDAGPNCQVANIYLSWVLGPSVGTTSPWAHRVYLAATDDATATTAIGDNTNLPGASLYLNPSVQGRFAFAELRFDSTPTGDPEYYAELRNVAVYGRHGLPLLTGIETPDPKGVAASDVIKHVVGKYCPMLNTSGVQATTHPIGHLVFKERIDPYDAFLEVNKYHLWQLAVYENRTLSYRPLDMSDYDWEVRLSDFGTTVDLQGDSTSDLANGIVVEYDDLGMHRPNTLSPDDYSELRDPNESNPATLAGLKKWTEIRLSDPGFEADALQLGRAALAEWNQPKSPGTINVQGHIRDRAGHYQPVWKVRAGDRVIISDHANDRPRLVVETDYGHDQKSISLAVDSSFKRLDAVLDQLGTALKAAGLAA